MPWDAIFGDILKGGGISPAIFLLAIGIASLAIIFWRSAEKENKDLRDKCAEQQNEAFLRENAGLKDTLSILDRNANNMATRTAAIDGTIAAINTLTQGFERLAVTIEAHREVQKGVGERLERQVGETVVLLNRLSADIQQASQRRVG